MDTHRFFVEKMRFHLHREDTIVFVGWFFDGSTKDHTLKVYLDEEELMITLQINKGAEIRQKYIRSINEINEEVVGIVKLPENWKNGSKLAIVSAWQGKERQDYSISVKKLYGLQNEINYYIENCHRENGKIKISGWCMGGGEIKLSLLDAKKQPIPVKIEHYYRKDLLGVYPEADKEAKPGFLVQAEDIPESEHSIYLQMRGAEHVCTVKLKKWDDGTFFQYLVEKAGDTTRYFARNGLSATLYKLNSKLRKKEINTYDSWRKKYEVTEEELKKQRKESFAVRPLFSIVVPLYKTNPDYLRKMIESVQNQTYDNWEICLADGSRGADGSRDADIGAKKEGTVCAADKSGAWQDAGGLAKIVESYQEADRRIHYCTLIQNAGISGNTNAAIKMASGDYIVLVDHDDIVAPNALYEFAKAIENNPQTDVLYSDEDKVSMDGKKYFEPHFKSDFNIDLLCSMNYICHLFAVRMDIIKKVGGFLSEYDGAQDHDFILRCCEQAKQICHVQKILYHWRCHMDSTAANPESKLYAFEAGRRAVEAHYKRLSIPAKVENAQFYGMYRTKYLWDREPLVSIIIPNKDHAEDLSKCVHSIYKRSNYRNFEIVIVENNSTGQETFNYYNELTAAHDNIRIVTYKGEFNFSKINNFGVEAARGEYLLLLNNDTEMIGEDCIREMLGYCMREDVGIVGAKLLYADETIQHAGVVIGFGGTAGHAFIGKSRFDTGYFGRILAAQDYSAVTAACLMTKRSVYEEVGGLTEDLAVAFNDIDFCLKVRETGKLVVYNPYAELYHYESKSRGYEDSPGKVERFNDEMDRLIGRWRDLIEEGDPYYNRNLTLDNSDFSLRR